MLCHICYNIDRDNAEQILLGPTTFKITCRCKSISQPFSNRVSIKLEVNLLLTCVIKSIANGLQYPPMFSFSVSWAGSEKLMP